ncbi:MAG: Pr6Pr family membrane protein [Pyrinomonadaceae bacterium]
MGEPSSKGERMFMVLVAAIGWAGLVIQFYVTFTHPNLVNAMPGERVARFFDFFTILTNLLVAVSLTISLLLPESVLGRFLSTNNARSAIALYIALVGVTYNILLRGTHAVDGWTGLAANEITHVIVPVLYIVFWLFFVPKGGLTWKNPIWWLIYPLLYLPYAFIRGATTGLYAYYFIDVGQLGIPAVMFNVATLLVVFLVIGEIVVGIDKLMGSKKLTTS